MKNHLQIWEEIILEFYKTVPKAKILTWFNRTGILSIDRGVCTIGVPREFYLSWHKDQSNKMLILLREHDPSIKKLEVTVDGLLETDKSYLTVDLGPLLGMSSGSTTESSPSARKMPRQSTVKITGKDGQQYISQQIDTKFTLQNFVIGEENQLAHAACQAVSNAPGAAYNPLFVYGSVGLGKTHLLQATANAIIKKNPRSLVVYLTTENFIAEVVEAIQKRKMDIVRKKYRMVDVFVLDDIQFLAGKDRTQEIFFHLFNDLYAGKKQMIFSSDRPPMELELTEERLKSRFSMGMIADVKFPGFETRLAISKVKAVEEGVMLDEELLNFIAYNVHHSIREVQGVILQTKAQVELQGITPTIASIGKILKELNKDQKLVGFNENQGEVSLITTMDQMVEGVCQFYNVAKSDIIGKGRKREFMRPRQVSMYLIKNHLSQSLQSIGQFFSGRDHTSVMHAIKKIKSDQKKEPEFWRELNTIQKQLGV